MGSKELDSGRFGATDIRVRQLVNEAFLIP